MVLLLLALQDLPIDDLSDSDLEVRERATETIVQAGARAVPEVVKLLASSDPELSSRAEQILLWIGLPAIPILDEQKQTALARKIVAARAALALTARQCEVTIRDADPWDPATELELGDGSGHGQSLRWRRFVPGAKTVEIVTFTLRSNLAVRRAEMPLADYRILLRLLATVAAASVERKPSNTYWTSSGNFWSAVRAGKYEEAYAGYPSTGGEPSYLRPRACLQLVDEWTKSLEFRDHALRDEDRAWASKKFIRDWGTMVDAESFWWVRERSIQIVGWAGEGTALPTLATILERDLVDGPRDREIGHAITAARRLLGDASPPKPDDLAAEKSDVLERIRR